MKSRATTETVLPRDTSSTAVLIVRIASSSSPINMNFVGTEVDVVTGLVTRPSPSSMYSDEDDEHLIHDSHPPISPKGGAESLFLQNLETQQISAYALAQQIHQQFRIDSTTVATEDYATAMNGSSSVNSASPVNSSSHDNLFFFPSSSTDLKSQPHNFFSFGNDALSHTRDLSSPFPTPHQESPQQFHDAQATMSTPSSTTSSSKPDAAEKAYDTAKNVWGWGKSKAILSPFLGIAEGVATKVVSMAGTSLTEVDGNIQHHLESLDGKYLNPAIAAVVSALLGTVSKSEEFLKPLLQVLLKPVALIKSSKDPESSNPELTTPPTAVGGGSTAIAAK